MGKIRHPSVLAIAWLALGIPSLAATGGGGEAGTRPRVPLAFAENRGQFAPEVRFQARQPGLVTSVLADGLYLEGAEGVLHLRFEGAAGGRAEGRSALAGRAHYLGGARDVRDVPTYARVRLRDLYPGIDLELYESDGRLEYDLCFAPGADPARVVIAFEGAGEVELEADGALRTSLGGLPLVQPPPLAFELDAGGLAVPVACAWKQLGAARYGFSHAPRRVGVPLVIDPVLVYATHVGGSNADEASAVFVDEQGALSATGWARSSDFPSTRPRPGVSARGKDAVLFKLAPDGRELVYSTTFGGRGDDQGMAVHVNARGQAIVAGTTDSDDFPTTENAYDRTACGGSDGFVVQFSADGSALERATFVGGSAEDQVAGMVLGPGGELTLAGTTRSRDYPVSSGSYGTEPRGGRDVFVTRLDARLERLLFSTRLGGSDDDECRGLAVDDEGASYLTGRTSSHDFPTTLGAYDRERCGIDAFVAKLSGGGRTLLYATFLGGSGQDEANAIAVDAEHRAVVVGWTQSLDFPFDGAQASVRKDAFAVRLAPMGNTLHWAVPLGGGSADEALGVALDPLGTPWIVGRTRSTDFRVTRDAHQARLAGPADAFLVRLAPEDGKVGYATLLGGEGEDALTGVHVDRTGGGLVLGGTSANIPQESRGALAGKRRGPSDAFVLRFDARTSAPRTPGGLRAGVELPF